MCVVVQARQAADKERGNKYEARITSEFERVKRLKAQEMTPDPVANVFRSGGAAAAAPASDEEEEGDEDDDGEEEEEDSDE